jgi:hypothetical protein
MHRLGLTMETYDDPARKIRLPSPKTVAGQPGSAGEENGAQLRKLRLREKVATQTLWCFDRARSTKSWSQAAEQGKKNEANRVS